MLNRQVRLTASDIKDLIPYTKNGNPRKITAENFIKVMARKNVDLTLDDAISYGAAARGHLLEPYAVEAVNSNLKLNLFHWDDTVVGENVKYSLAYSPDALDIKQPDQTFAFVDKRDIEPGLLCEIKCYSIEKHIITGTSNPSLLEERWQIATAMATSPTISEGILALYNPSSKYQLFAIPYTRRELKEEIETVLDIEKQWIDFVHNDWDSIVRNNKMFVGNPLDERRIIIKLEQQNRLNP